MPSITDAAANGCGNCGEALTGPYCHGCGAKRMDGQDLSLRHFAGEATQELTSLEHSKLLRTLRALLIRPGLLTAEYFSARRGRYVRPLPLVLAVFALNLFAFSASDDVRMFDIERQARTQAEMVKSRGLSEEPTIGVQVRRASERQKVPVAMLNDRINDVWQANASWIQLPQILLFALVLQLAHLFSRRHFVEHLVFSMHFISFQVLTVVAMWPLYFAFGIQASGLMIGIVAVKFLIDTIYLFVALRRFYPDRLGKTLLRAPFVFGGYFLVYVTTHALAMSLAIRSVVGGS